MLSDVQIQQIEENCKIVLILQNEDVVLFMEKETEKQVIVNFVDVVSEKVKQELSGNKPVKKDDGYYWTASWSSSTDTTNYMPNVIVTYGMENT